MRDKLPFLLAAGIVPLAASAAGRDCASGFYLGADLGAAFQQQIFVTGADRIEFHNGVRGDLSLGYRFAPWLATEFASGVIWNSVDKIGGVTVSSYGGGIDLYQIPIMGNVVLSVPLKHGLQPYLGAGVGCVAGMLEFHSPLGNIHDTDYTFSYQLFGGLNYRISRHTEAGVGYKFLRTRDHGWSDGGVTFHTDGTTTHSVTASFTWKF